MIRAGHGAADLLRESESSAPSDPQLGGQADRQDGRREAKPAEADAQLPETKREELARPGIVVATVLSFILSWNNFIFGVVLCDRRTTTLPVAVYNVMSFSQVNWGHLAAVALVVTTPVLVLTLLMQKQIAEGLTAGGLKGG